MFGNPAEYLWMIPVLPLHGPRCCGRRSGDGFLGGDLLVTVLADQGDLTADRDIVVSDQALYDFCIDLLGMDACLMSTLEVAYQTRANAVNVVGSEELEPGDGWPPFIAATASGILKRPALILVVTMKVPVAGL